MTSIIKPGICTKATPSERNEIHSILYCRTLYCIQQIQINGIQFSYPIAQSHKKVWSGHGTGPSALQTQFVVAISLFFRYHHRICFYILLRQIYINRNNSGCPGPSRIRAGHKYRHRSMRMILLVCFLNIYDWHSIFR